MKPIGYWLNRTDEALTHHMNGMLNEFGLTRIAWQVLNVVEDTLRSRTPTSYRSSRPTPMSPP
ncbi:hypothetical protein ACFQX6_05420 [Streptosporangium lutulentum]